MNINQGPHKEFQLTGGNNKRCQKLTGGNNSNCLKFRWWHRKLTGGMPPLTPVLMRALK